jgi:LysM repeat protein
MERRRHSPARFLAPLALLLAVGAILLVISSGSGGSDDDGGSASSGTTATQTSGGSTETTETTTTTTGRKGPKWYEVKPGDTLSAISDATGVPLEQIEQLNEDIDSQSLTVGQRIQLRP